LRGTSLNKVLQGAVLGILSFGGFETATIFGQEARNPMREIPLAMIASVVFAGVLWTVAGYTLFLGFQGSGFNLAHSSQPLHDLAKIAHIGWFSYIIDFSISITLYSSMIAVFNSISRLMFTGAREGLGPRYWSRLHPQRQTPSAAINTIGGVFTVAIVGIIVSQAPPFEMFDDFGDLSGVGYIALYAVICVGSVAFFARRRNAGVLHIALAGGSVVALGYVFYSNVVPWPPFPDDLSLGIAIAVIVGSALWWVVLRARSPRRLAGIGSTTVTAGEDLTADAREELRPLLGADGPRGESDRPPSGRPVETRGGYAATGTPQRNRR
jgi:amino acid transporter